jgi:hypothetical protein
MTAINALQQSIYQQLTGDTALMNMVNGVYDRALQGSEYPYITFGNIQGTDWSSNTTRGFEAHLTLHIWSREGGRKEAVAIMERVYSLIHDDELTPEGYHMVLLRLINSTVNLEKDGWTYHGELTFRTLLEQNT